MLREAADALTLVAIHHAFKSVFKAFSHTVAVAHNAFHGGELGHVTGHQPFHTLFNIGQFFFELGNLICGTSALGLDQTGGPEHSVDAVEGTTCQASWRLAEDALVVGARAEHGRDFDEVVLQGGVEFGFVEGELAKAVKAEAHIARGLDGGAGGGRGACDQVAHLGAHCLEHAFARQDPPEIFDFARAVAQDFQGFFKVVVGSDQALDVVFDACRVAVQVDARSACGGGVQVKRHAVDHIVNCVAAAGDVQAVDREAGIGRSLKRLCKSDGADGAGGVGPRGGHAEGIGRTRIARQHNLVPTSGVDQLRRHAQFGPVDGADHACWGGRCDIDRVFRHCANGQVNLKGHTAVECGVARRKGAAGRALGESRLRHSDAVVACFGTGAGRHTKGRGLRVGRLDGAEVAGIVEFAQGGFDFGQGELDGPQACNFGLGFGNLGFDTFFFRRFFGVYQALGQASHVDAGACTQGVDNAAGGHGWGSLVVVSGLSLGQVSA